MKCSYQCHKPPIELELRFMVSNKVEITIPLGNLVTIFQVEVLLKQEYTQLCLAKSYAEEQGHLDEGVI